MAPEAEFKSECQLPRLNSSSSRNCDGSAIQADGLT